MCGSGVCMSEGMSAGSAHCDVLGIGEGVGVKVGELACKCLGLNVCVVFGLGLQWGLGNG